MPNNFDRGEYDPRCVGGSRRYRVGHSSSPRDSREENFRRLDVGYRGHSPSRSDRERSSYHSIHHRHARDLDVDKSKFALDIINAVIGYKSSVIMRDRSPQRKRFRSDRGVQRPHEDLPRDHHHSQSVWERLGEGGPTYHHPSLLGSGDHQDCRMAKSHQSQPLYKARTSKSSRDPQPKEGKAVPNPRSRGSDKRNRWEANERTERHTSEDQKSSEKTRKNVDQEKGEEEELSEEFISLPRKALKCHICDKKLFVSSKSYMDHIRGRAHRILRAAYQDNIDAQISLLQANSQMAEYQRITNSKLKFSSKRRCNLCKCSLASIKRQHNRTKEHRELLKYVHVRCCGTNFFTRDKYEDHCLTLEHHKNEWYKNGEMNMKKEEGESNQKEEEDQQEKEGGEEEAEERKKYADLHGTKPPNEEIMFGNIVEELYRKSHHPEVTSLKSLEPYDPSVPHGLNFLSKKSTYQCGVCPNSRLVNGNTIERHFHSSLHYSNLYAHFKLLHDNKELKEKNKKKMNTDAVEEKRTGGFQEPKEKLEEEQMGTVEEKSKECAEDDKVKVKLLWVKDQDQDVQKKIEKELLKEKDRGEQEKEVLAEKIDQDKEVDGDEPEELAAKINQDEDIDSEELPELVNKREQDKQQGREVKEVHEKEEHIKEINQDKQQDKEEQEKEELINEREQNKKQHREQNENQEEDVSQEKGEEQEKKQDKQEEEEVDSEEKEEWEEEENCSNDNEVDLADIDNMETVDEVCDDDDDMGDLDGSVDDEDDEMIDLQEVGEEIDTKIDNLFGEEQE